ncbi:MAG: fumarylacetoacetate hydrolase family protein [Planctomycetota bacterium]|nr:fumarylacetoacetate hydrolase family protein [Planctomycetota bacterium]MDA1025176.1 fumarylacetoacetate hydrolase family protein [Planctomycetota bacterium]
MKIVHFRINGESKVRFGAITPDGAVIDGTDLLEMPDHDRFDLGVRDRFDVSRPALAKLRERVHTSNIDRTPITDCELMSPVPVPGKVICIGLNYADHAAESGMEPPASPLAFSKFSCNVIGPGGVVPVPLGTSETDYEAELAVVVGRRAWRVAECDAMEHVLGYACANDLSARAFQFADGQWQRGKSCEGFCPLGPYIATKDEIPDPHQLRIRLRLNGELVQDSSTNQLIFRIPALIAHLSSFVALDPGDIILTGTPPGVGFARTPPIHLKAGDRMEVEIDGLGILENTMN